MATICFYLLSIKAMQQEHKDTQANTPETNKPTHITSGSLNIPRVYNNN